MTICEAIPPLRRKSARDLWVTSRNLNPQSFPNHVVPRELGQALGPWIVVRAILDIAAVSLEHAWMDGGLTERFVKYGQGSWVAQKTTEFVRYMNQCADQRRIKERFSLSLFNTTFYAVNEVEHACQPSDSPPAASHRAFGLREGEDMLEGVGLERVAEIHEALCNFACAEGHGIYVLCGGRGTGKRTAFSKMLTETTVEASGSESLRVLVDCEERLTFPQVVQHLYHGLVPSREVAAGATPAQMMFQIETSLRVRRLIIVFNNFDALEDHTENGETVIRDDGLFAILQVLLSERAIGTRLFIGTSVRDDARYSLALQRLASEAGVRIVQGTMPDLCLRHGRELVERNRHADCEVLPSPTGADILLPVLGDAKVASCRDAAACYSAFLNEQLAGYPDPPTLVTILIAASIALASQLPRRLSSAMNVLPHELRDAHFEPQGWKAFNACWRECADATRAHDHKRLLAFVLAHAKPGYAAAIRLIALSEDGLRATSLAELLTAHKAAVPNSGIDDVMQLMTHIENHSLQPLVQLGTRDVRDGTSEPVFDMHRIFRRTIVQLSEESPEWLAASRMAHSGIARLALRRHRTEAAEQTLIDRTAMYRRPIQFVRHAFASLSPESLRDVQLPDPGDPLDERDYAALGHRVLQGEAEACEVFYFALKFYEHEIQGGKNYRLHRNFAADGLKIDLLLRPFHIGYFLPPACFSLGFKERTVPPNLPFSSLPPKAKTVQVRQERWRTVREVAGTMAKALESSGVQRRSEPLPEEWSKIGDWIGKFSATLEQLGESPQVDQVRELLRSCIKLLRFAVAGGIRDEARACVESHDRWGLQLFAELAVAARHADNEAIFAACIAVGRALAVMYGDPQAERQLERNIIEWRLRKGQLEAGVKEAQRLAATLQSDVERKSEELANSPSPGKTNDFRQALRAYHGPAGRVADFEAALGELERAAESYTSLICSKASKLGALGGHFPTVPPSREWLNESASVRGSTARNFVRFVLRFHQLNHVSSFAQAPGLSDLIERLAVRRNQFPTEQLQRLVAKAREILTHETDSIDRAPDMAIERAAMGRFDDLNQPDGAGSLLEAARKDIECARRASLSGSFSVLKRLRLLSEEAHWVWHGIVFHGHCSEDAANPQVTAEGLGRALYCLSHVIALAEVRNLPTQMVDALLLRAEIMGCCFLSTRQQTCERQAIAWKIVSPSIAREVRIRHAERCSPVADLDRAGRVIEETGYRKRMVEWTVLRTTPGTTPCAYLLT